MSRYAHHNPDDPGMEVLIARADHAKKEMRENGHRAHTCPKAIARWADPAYALAQDLARFDRYLDDLTTPPDGASALTEADKRFYGRAE